MDVDTRLLRYFAAVAAEGNLTGAAERLFVSQPALTKQIRQLENQLGVRVFARSRAGMTLTPAGQALTDRVPAVLAGLDVALREAKSAASRASRMLRVGFLAGAANEATQQIIAVFARRRRGWRVEMRAAPGPTPPPGWPAARPMSRCCGCPSPARTACGPRCCSPSPAGSRSPPPIRSPDVT
jgi:DNA-binding transcriptional LysR family regulator